MIRLARTPTAVGLVALVVGSLLSIRVLSQVGWDPTVFIAFGTDATATTTYAEERLGEVSLRTGQGHDGKFFFVQAHDPLILEPESNAQILDHPLYRSQRMLYPLLAGGLGLFGSRTIAWALLVVNLIAIGAGTHATARVARFMDGSPWWGMAFALNIGLLSEVIIGGAGVVAAALAFGAVASVLDEDHRSGVILLVLSALAREVFLITALGTAWWLRRRGERNRSWIILLVPAAAVGLWAAYLRFRIGWDVGLPDVKVFGPPFLGLMRAIPKWLDQPLNLVAGIGMLMLFVLFLRRTLISNALVGWAFLGFVPLAFLLTDLVWVHYFDFSRAVAPVITAFVLMMFLGNRVPMQRSPLA